MNSAERRAATEAMDRLRLLLGVSRLLGRAVDDLGPALRALVEECVPDFCDLCAVEMLGPTGVPELAAFRVSPVSGLTARWEWPLVGEQFALRRSAALSHGGTAPDETLDRLRARLDADSVIVAPIAAGGVALGWMFCVNGRNRRGLRPSAVSMAEEMSRQIGVAAQRVLLHREQSHNADVQGRTARQLRRFAGAAGQLAGATTAIDVLSVACVQACLVVDANGALATWEVDGATRVHGSAGDVDPAGAALLAAVLDQRGPLRRDGWVAIPLVCSDAGHRAALAVHGAMSEPAEAMLGSFAALVPVAFERALVTDASHHRQQQLQAILETSPVALVTASVDGSVIEGNAAAASLFGWGDDRQRPAFPDAIAPLMAAVIRNAFEAGRVQDVAVAAEPFDLSVSASIVRQGQDDASVILVASDLRQQHLDQKAVLHAQRLEAMGQLAGGLAHDFNNLLTIILGSAAAVPAAAERSEQVGLAGAIGDAARRAADLTGQLLSFARRPVDEAATIDLGEALTELAPVIRRVVGNRVRLEIDPGTEAVTVAAGRSEVEQVILNLVINARDAVERRGGVQVAVDLAEVCPGDAGAVPAGTYGRLLVADDGIGMDEVTQLRCLEPFYTTKEAGQGSGLGLSTVYGVVHERRGHLAIDSEVGRGTAVTVLLPAAAPGPERAASPAGDACNVGPPAHGS